MDFKVTIEINRKIMALIKSKYSNDFPLAYNNPDAQYYNRLDAEVFKAEKYLESSSKE